MSRMLWRLSDAVVHIIHEDLIPDLTWCGEEIRRHRRVDGLGYADPPATCLGCIAREFRYYSLFNIRRLR